MRSPSHVVYHIVKNLYARCIRGTRSRCRLSGCGYIPSYIYTFFTRYGYGYCYSVTEAKTYDKVKAATGQPWIFWSCHTKRILTRKEPDLKFRWDQPAGPVLTRISELHSAIFPPSRLIIDPLIPERWLTSPPSPNYSHFLIAISGNLGLA